MVFLIVSIQSCILFSILSKTLILNMNIRKNKSYKYFIGILKPTCLLSMYLSSTQIFLLFFNVCIINVDDIWIWYELCLYFQGLKWTHSVIRLTRHFLWTLFCWSFSRALFLAFCQWYLSICPLLTQWYSLLLWHILYPNTFHCLHMLCFLVFKI